MKTETKHAPISVDCETFNGRIEKLHCGFDGRSLTLSIELGSDLHEHEEQGVLGLLASAPRLMEERDALLAALEELCADKYLADPINNDRMAPARAAIAKVGGAA